MADVMAGINPIDHVEEFLLRRPQLDGVAYTTSAATRRRVELYVRHDLRPNCESYACSIYAVAVDK